MSLANDDSSHVVGGRVAAAADHPINAVPLRHPGRWSAVAVACVLAAMFAHALVTDQRFQWPVVGEYLANPAILQGILRTLELTVISMAVGIVLGAILAVMRLSPNPILRVFSWLYVWFFRGTPVLVQLIFWYNLAALIPRISFGIPFGPAFASASANTLISVYSAAILGLGLNQAAYTSEIIRAGVLSLEEGQIDAAIAIGMTRAQTFRHIIFPQAMKVVIPPIGNETIGMLKNSSIVSVISVPELLYAAELIYSRTYQTIPLLIVASLWYLAITTILSVAQFYIERHFAKGTSRAVARRPARPLLAGARRALGGER